MQACLHFSPESVCQPTSKTWVTHQDAARIHLINRLWMIHAVAVQRTDHTQIVCVFGEMRHEVGNR